MTLQPAQTRRLVRNLFSKTVCRGWAEDIAERYDDAGYLDSSPKFGFPG